MSTLCARMVAMASGCHVDLLRKLLWDYLSLELSQLLLQLLHPSVAASQCFLKSFSRSFVAVGVQTETMALTVSANEFVPKTFGLRVGHVPGLNLSVSRGGAQRTRTRGRSSCRG